MAPLAKQDEFYVPECESSQETPEEIVEESFDSEDSSSMPASVAAESSFDTSDDRSVTPQKDSTKVQDCGVSSTSPSPLDSDISLLSSIKDSKSHGDPAVDCESDSSFEELKLTEGDKQSLKELDIAEGKHQEIQEQDICDTKTEIKPEVKPENKPVSDE